VKLLVAIAAGLRPLDLAEAPVLRSLAAEGFAAPLETVFPALTCPVQATFLTGKLPREHGIVGNGWYHRDTAEVRFWLQSNRLVEGAKVYERAALEDVAFVCAKLFWWFNLYGAAAISATPRPEYHADGLKVPDISTVPPELRDRLVRELGAFPLHRFWGPGAGIESTEWIARAAVRVLEEHDPTLALVYLPHLDYDHQRFGPDDPRSRRAVADLDRALAPLVETARAGGREILVLGEYGIEPVDRALFPNRDLRERGLLAVRATGQGDLLDPGASRAFAVVDHQVAHVYVRDPTDLRGVREALGDQDGVRVLDRAAQRSLGVDHPRAGELVLIAPPGCWFAYPYWLEESRRPDFAPTVDIHRKPGYDPAELFLDPRLRAPRLRVAMRLAARRLGFRTLFDVVPTDPALVRGSHGRLPEDPERGPVAVGSFRRREEGPLRATEVADLILARLRS
jgi:predicted AlkP superfamily pyrophosphatase or phosphodiesterase